MSRQIKTGLDDFHWERRYVVVRRGLMRFVKRQTNKRERREGKTDSRQERNEP